MSKYTEMINKANQTLTTKNEALAKDNAALIGEILTLKQQIRRLTEENDILGRQKCDNGFMCRRMDAGVFSLGAMMGILKE